MTEDKLNDLTDIILKSLGGDQQHKQLAFKIANDCEDFIDDELDEQHQGFMQHINRG